MRSSPMLTTTSRGMQPYCIYYRFLSEGRTLVLFLQVRNDDRDKATLCRVLQAPSLAQHLTALPVTRSLCVVGGLPRQRVCPTSENGD